MKAYKWMMMEIDIPVKNSISHFDDMEAIFVSPKGKMLRSGAFYYDENLWKVRFTPGETGIWSYNVGYNGSKLIKGKFECIDYCSKGFIEINKANPCKFRFSCGEPVFLSGETCYRMIWLDRDKERIPYIEKRVKQGFNYFRFSAFNGIEKSYTFRNPKYEIPSVVYDESGEMYINPQYFKNFDNLMDDLAAHGAYAEINIFNFYVKDMLVQNGWNDKKEADWLKYILHRYGAYPNMFLWTLANEFDLYPDGRYRLDVPGDIEWYHRVSVQLKKMDIYNHPVAVHPVNFFECPAGAPVNSPGYGFGDCPTLDVVMNQVHGSTVSKDGYMDGSGFGIEVKVLSDRRYNKPVLIAEFGYEYDGKSKYGVNVSTELQLRQAWRIIMGGGYFAAGFRGTATSRELFDIANNGKPGATYLSYLNDFMRKHTEFNLLEPRWGLVESPHLCLAAPGREYVVFIPFDYGKFNGVTVDLIGYDREFAIVWLNPYTGEYINGGTIRGGDRICLESPQKGIDMILHLENKG